MDETIVEEVLDKESSALLYTLNLTISDIIRKQKMGSHFSREFKQGNLKLRKACLLIFRANQHLVLNEGRDERDRVSQTILYSRRSI